MPSVLAIEPHADRAALLRTLAEPHFGESLALVDSVENAFAAMDQGVPEVILMSPLLPPDEEAQLIAGLRALPKTLYVQTLITPDVVRPDGESRFLRRVKQKNNPAAGGTAFGSQLKAYVDAVREERSERAETLHHGGAERRTAFRIAAKRGPTATLNGVRVALVDLSATGAQIIVPSLLAPGRFVEFGIDSGRQIVKTRAAVVWGAIDHRDSAEPRCRAGLQFTDREALAGYCLESGAEGPEEPSHSGIVRSPSQGEVERARRLRRGDLPWLAEVRLPGGGDATLLNLSSTGVLLETSVKFAPGTAATIHFCGPDEDLPVRVRFVRSEVVGVNARGVRYLAAAAFETELDLDDLHVTADGESTPKAVADWLKQLSSELYRGGEPVALRKRMKDGLTGLLNARDVEIRREPVPPPDGCDSIYFTIAAEGDAKAVLQVTFDPGHAPSAQDFRLLRAASALASVLFSAA